MKNTLANRQKLHISRAKIRKNRFKNVLLIKKNFVRRFFRFSYVNKLFDHVNSFSLQGIEREIFFSKLKKNFFI